mgnify:CR=1 FL=1
MTIIIGAHMSIADGIMISLEQTVEEERRFFALFAYEYAPESNLFTVYNYNQKMEGKEHLLFFKLVYLFKLFG